MKCSACACLNTREHFIIQTMIRCVDKKLVLYMHETREIWRPVVSDIIRKLDAQYIDAAPRALVMLSCSLWLMVTNTLSIFDKTDIIDCAHDVVSSQAVVAYNGSLSFAFLRHVYNKATRRPRKRPRLELED